MKLRSSPQFFRKLLKFLQTQVVFFLLLGLMFLNKLSQLIDCLRILLAQGLNAFSQLSDRLRLFFFVGVQLCLNAFSQLSDCLRLFFFVGVELCLNAFSQLSDRLRLFFFVGIYLISKNVNSRLISSNFFLQCFLQSVDSVSDFCVDLVSVNLNRCLSLSEFFSEGVCRCDKVLNEIVEA